MCLGGLNAHSHVCLSTRVRPITSLTIQAEQNVKYFEMAGDVYRAETPGLRRHLGTLVGFNLEVTHKAELDASRRREAVLQAELDASTAELLRRDQVEAELR